MGGSVCLRVQFLVSALRSLFGRDVQNIVCRSGSEWLGHAMGALLGSGVLWEALGASGSLCESLMGDCLTLRLLVLKLWEFGEVCVAL